VRISIQKKHETAWSEKWTIPGVLAGNEIPAAWIDGGAGNSLVRRMLIVEFPNKPQRQDPNLRQRLLEELPAIMVKSNRLYQTIAASIGTDGDIDAAMPTYFHDTLDRFRAKTQPFVYMIKNHPDLVRLPHAEIHLLELKKVYKDWCSANGNRYSQLDDDEIRRQIASLGLRVVEFKPGQTHEYKGKRHHGVFIFGIGLRAETETNVYHASGGGGGGGSGSGSGSVGGGGGGHTPAYLQTPQQHTPAPHPTAHSQHHQHHASPATDFAAAAGYAAAAAASSYTLPSAAPPRDDGPDTFMDQADFEDEQFE